MIPDLEYGEFLKLLPTELQKKVANDPFLECEDVGIKSHLTVNKYALQKHLSQQFLPTTKCNLILIEDDYNNTRSFKLIMSTDEEIPVVKIHSIVDEFALFLGLTSPTDLKIVELMPTTESGEVVTFENLHKTQRWRIILWC
jgi:hypothetical protein